MKNYLGEVIEAAAKGEVPLALAYDDLVNQLDRAPIAYALDLAPAMATAANAAANHLAKVHQRGVCSTCRRTVTHAYDCDMSHLRMPPRHCP